jgi:molybdopterin-containing oxidoreductase family iron-sulfur binding subunit
LANNLPIGIWWNKVTTEGGTTIDTAAGSYPNCTLRHYPIACQHCKAPACVAVCPVDATYKDEETGLVVQDNEACIGCKICMEACPYDARVFNGDNPAYTLDFVVGNEKVEPHLENVVEKCTMCQALIEEGVEPMCVQACIGYARHFGDLDDPASEVSQLIAARENLQLLAEQGTGPSVYYLK